MHQKTADGQHQSAVPGQRYAEAAKYHRHVGYQIDHQKHEGTNGNTKQNTRVNHGAADLAQHLGVFLLLDGQALEDFIEQPARLASLDHIYVNAGKNIRGVGPKAALSVEPPSTRLVASAMAAWK